MEEQWRGVGRYGTVGLEFALSIVFGFLIGDFLDSRLDSAPWFTIFWTLVGLAAGSRAIYRAAKAAEREAEELEKNEREARRRYHEQSTRKRSHQQS